MLCIVLLKLLTVHIHTYGSKISSELWFFLLGGMWRLENDVSLTAMNLSVLSGCGDNLMDTVCRDACSGHDVPKVSVFLPSFLLLLSYLFLFLTSLRLYYFRCFLFLFWSRSYFLTSIMFG